MSLFDGSKERMTYEKMAHVLGVHIPGHTLLYDVPALLMENLLDRIINLHQRVTYLEKLIEQNNSNK